MSKSIMHIPVFLLFLNLLCSFSITISAESRAMLFQSVIIFLNEHTRQRPSAFIGHRHPLT